MSTVTQSDLVTARSNLTGQISEVMSEILQTPEGENVRYSCSLTGQPLTGQQVLDSMPASFVDQQVQFVAEASALEEDLAGVGSSSADLQSYFSAHSAQFDTACLSAAVFSSESAAQAGATQVAAGTPFATLAASTSASGGGALGCDVLSDLITKLPAEADLKNLATGVVSPPINDNGTYVLLQITSRTPTAYSKAKTAVENAVQQAGATVTQKRLASLERRSSVSVNPQYGVWVPVNASVLTPLTPNPSDVLNPSANIPAAVPAVSAVPGAGASGTGSSGAGTSGTGNSGVGTSGTGNSGVGTSGTGNSGVGTSGAGNSGAGAASSSSGSVSSTPSSG